MKKFSILIFIGFLITVISCSKKEDVKVGVENVNKNQTPTNSKQTNSNQTGSNQTNSSGTTSFFNIQSTGDSKDGKEFADFTWTENGKENKLSDHKGKVLFLNFWATWCGPCRKELPDLSSISEQLKGKNFRMIGVSVDEDQNALSKFLTANKISYTVLNDQSNLVEKYMKISKQPDNVIPQSYIIDKNGKVVEVIVGSRPKEEFLKLINKYL